MIAEIYFYNKRNKLYFLSTIVMEFLHRWGYTVPTTGD